MPATFIEPLEPRQLLSGIFFHVHVLRVIGSRMPNVETVGLTADGASVEVSLSFTNRRGPQLLTKTVPLADRIGLVALVGGNGADSITVDQTNGVLPMECRMFGGGGSDTIIGGDEPDSITGGRGNDSLVGGDGNDTIYGNGGNDTIYGNNGNDWLNGGLGHDSIVGGDGNDTLADAYGPDTMYGGAGNNLFIGAAVGKHKDVTDFDRTTDRIRIVSTTVPSTSSIPSWLQDAFPILSWF